MTRYLSSGLGSVAFFLIAIAILAGGCNRWHSNNTTATSVSQLSPSLAGKRITVRGKLFMFKCGQGIGLDDGEAICLVGTPAKSVSDDPYAGMYDKPLEVTGTLMYYHDSAPPDGTPRQHDHYYFEKKTTRMRVMTEYIDNTTVSSAGSQLSQALVGKRITIRGKLLGFKCGPSIELDDGEFVCLEDMHPKPIYEPYPGMFDKPVKATGTLRFFHNTTPIDETLSSQREQDHYYFETETTQVRRITSAPADLQITSPVSGAIVQPGQSFSVSVASPDSTAFTKVIVVGEEPFGFSTLQNGVPTRVSFTVPTDIECQSYAFTAVGTTASGRDVESVPILIDVERPDLPTSVSTPTSPIMMSAPGETAALFLLAKFADGTVLDVRRSSRVVYTSMDTKVATVDADGIVTAVSPGRVFVTATYTVAGAKIPTTILVSVSTPTLTPSKFSVTFGSQAVGTSSSQRVTLTNMAKSPVRAISLDTTGDFSESGNCRSLSPLPSGGKCVVNITFKPTALGTRPGELVIVNSSDTVQTTLPLSGSGTEP